MHHDLHAWIRTAVLAAGVATLIGSGGGFPDIGPPDPGSIAPQPGVDIEPARITLQVGSSVRLVAQVRHTTQPHYQWCRVPAGGTACADIPGATGDSYTVAAVNLADDGAQFGVSVTDPNGGASAWSALFVSSMPPVVIQDGDFAPAAWSVATIAEPVTGGPSAVVGTVPEQGHPGAYRQTTIQVPVVPSSLQIFQTRDSTVYDPAAQGAIHVIDATEDCVTPGTSTSNAYIGTVPLLVQTGRRYVATTNWSRGCSGSDTWVAAAPRVALVAGDFRLIDGPACMAGEACPDFGVGAAPIQLGFAQLVEMSAAGRTGTRTRGIDNWQITIWRK